MAAPQQQKTQERKQLIERRVLIVSVVIIFLGIAVVLWILNAQGIITGSWSNALSIIFTFLGVLIGLFQWLFPISSDTNGAARTSMSTADQFLQVQSANPALPPIILHMPSLPSTIGTPASTELAEKALYRGIMGLPPPTDPRTIQQRAQAVQEVYTLLTRPANSAVVLTGIGGVGKSTLAALVYSWTEQQRQSGQSYFDEPAIWLTIDAGVTMADLAGNLCEVFEKPLPDFSNLSLQHQAMALFNILNTPDECRLLVLDQFENLLDWQTGHALANRPGVGEWLDALNSRPCRSRILMTTRLWPLGTREYPSTCMREYTVKGLEKSEGIELLRKSGIEASDQALLTVVERCGGHAFALTLLASLLRNRGLSLTNFFNDPGYTHVWTGNVARNLVDHIYTSQLNEVQREILLGFSVYREPVPLAAALALCSFDSTISTAQIQQALDALLAQHLLQPMGDGEYQLHTIIKDYAQDNFVAHNDTMNSQALLGAHARAAQYYLSSAKTKTPPRGKRDHLNDFDPLIEAAWQFCQAHQWNEAYKLINREKLFSDLKSLGALAILLELYKLLLPLEKWHASPAKGAHIYNRLGSLYRSLGRHELSLEYLEKASKLGHETGDVIELAWSLNHFGRLYANTGDKERARTCYEGALKYARAKEDLALTGSALNNLGWIYHSRGEKDLERKYYEEALSTYRTMGDRTGEAATLNNLGLVAESLGQSELAIRYYNEALTIFEERRHWQGRGWSLNNLGRTYFLAGDNEHARIYLERALEIRREVDRRGEGRTLNNLGAVYADSGDYTQSWHCYEQALAITSEVADSEGRGKTFRNIGHLRLAQKQYRLALAFTLCARTLLTAAQSPGNETLQNDLDQLQQALGAETFSTLLAEVEPHAQEIVDQDLQV